MKTNNIFKVTILSAFIIMSTSAFAQTLSELNTYVQKVRIGLVDEFFDRFNGKTIHPDISGTKPDSRKNNLMMLFDLSQFLSKDDPLFNEASEMMNTVIADSLNINYSDSTWAALAHCKGTLDGKSVTFDLFLTVQHRKKNMYKWVIAKADGSLFDITPRNTNDNIMLLPDDHETNFLSLKRMTSEQPFNVNQFLTKGFDYDKTSAFTFLVYSGKLKIDYVDNLEFVFTQIPGYIFHLKYFERENTNAGWLISNFYKTTEENKALLMHDLHLQNTINIEISAASQQQGENTITDNSDRRNLKEIYARRLNEKLVQVEDYIHFLQQNDSLCAQSVYKTKMENLFIDGAKVFIHDSRTSTKSTKSISEFCDMLIEKSCECSSIDSICTPILDDKILALDSTINKVEVLANIRIFVENKITDNVITSNYDQVLFVYKENTEDGIEWLPILGDIMITIK